MYIQAVSAVSSKDEISLLGILLCTFYFVFFSPPPPSRRLTRLESSSARGVFAILGMYRSKQSKQAFFNNFISKETEVVVSKKNVRQSVCRLG